MRAALLPILFVIPWSLAAAERTRSPAEASVFIRVIGSVEVRVGSAWTETEEERNVELGTGSGFVFTEYGHVLTNHHVISGEVQKGRLRTGEEVEVRVDVERIEVVFPGLTPAMDALTGRESVGASAYDATIEVSDPELDLAVLSIGGADLPYLALGDSDAAEPGEAVSVYGFPFGRKLELGRENVDDVDDIVPSVSVTRGTMSATRANDAGGAAFLQTSATVNPGNSGGPMVDSEGFVLGVIRLKLRGGDGVGFAVPVESVKDFLEYRGYLPLLPTERLRLGPSQTLPGKGLSLALPDTMEDRSPVRLSAFSDPAARERGVVFVSERVASPWELARLQELLLSGGTFGTFRAGGEQESQAFAGGRLIVGWASGVDGRTGQEAKLEYALYDAGYEKVLVRYEGTSEAVAFNRSVLIGSLASIEAEPLLTAEIASPVPLDRMEWVARSLPLPGDPFFEVPASWIDEPSAPFPCQGLAPVDSALAVSPAGDFTVSLRMGYRREGADPIAARQSCHPGVRSGPEGDASYSYTVDWLGVRYVVEGLFVRRGSGLAQLELVAPGEKKPFVSDLARDFFARHREAAGGRP